MNKEHTAAPIETHAGTLFAELKPKIIQLLSRLSLTPSRYLISLDQNLNDNGQTVAVAIRMREGERVLREQDILIIETMLLTVLTKHFERHKAFSALQLLTINPGEAGVCLRFAPAEERRNGLQ